ncbi:MAG: XdhC/CoxI family protein [Clostridiaceae bacterium]|nr:XdhC family protein [Eubacteriales bacterium]
MKAILEAIKSALERGEDTVLCIVVASFGSTPRGKGAKMAVFADGSAMGTVGGGAVEYHSFLAAKDALREKRSFLKGFDLSSNQAADIGMICGGKVEVYFQYFSAQDARAREALDHIVSLFGRSADAWLVIKLSEETELGVYKENEGLRFLDIPESSVRPLLKNGGVLHREKPALYVEPLVQSGYVYVFGGGHVSRELVPVLEHVGFRPVVYDDREAFATPEFFPKAERTLTGPFTEIGSRLSVTAKDYVVIMTRGHQADYEALAYAMRTDASYIGMIGSRGKIAAVYKRIVEAGIPEAELRRVHAPIGLSIKAETPAEIAISIAAELILHRAELMKI